MNRPATTVREPLDLAMLAEVRGGLMASRKQLPPKFFYDERGSELFEAITALPEYYPTRAEREILGAWMPELIDALTPRALVELGAGSADKTRVILDAMVALGGPRTYVPLDVSADFLYRSARALRHEYPTLTVMPVVADIADTITAPAGLGAPALWAFLGSTIGNFTPAATVRLLYRVRAWLRDGDRFLIGMDLRKDVAVLEAAYNDSAGVTAAFNLNVLQVLNGRLGADFDVEAFHHRAFYREAGHRIEMHLVSSRDQQVTIPGIGVIDFREGESIRTEISCKYDRETAQALLADAGLRLVEWRTDRAGRFALALAMAGR